MSDLLVFSNFSKVDNIGDLYSCPLDYFPGDFVNYSKVNFIDLNLLRDNKGFPNLILGGGGMLHEGFIDILERFSKHPKRKKLIIWGAGINEHNLVSQFFPLFLNNYNLVGLRDYNNPWNYVPCPSCLHTVFNSINDPITDFVIFNHVDHPIPVETTFRRNNIKQPRETIETIINFLSQGETVITNSYHGIYWSLLINRKVLVWEPFSNRFYGFKPNVTYCDRYNWINQLDKTQRAYPGYLEECRNINYEFKDKVLRLTYSSG